MLVSALVVLTPVPEQWGGGCYSWSLPEHAPQLSHSQMPVAISKEYSSRYDWILLNQPCTIEISISIKLCQLIRIQHQMILCSPSWSWSVWCVSWLPTAQTPASQLPHHRLCTSDRSAGCYGRQQALKLFLIGGLPCYLITVWNFPGVKEHIAGYLTKLCVKYKWL